jgi:hypothetical protein
LSALVVWSVPSPADGCGISQPSATGITRPTCGIDFDVEGQSQDIINNPVQRVVAAERSFPNVRFRFAIAALGGKLVRDGQSAIAAAENLHSFCAPGSASATCNSYGQAGRFGFTTRFLSSLGQ